VSVLKITNDHLEIFHEGFCKDLHGHVKKEEGRLNPNPLRNQRSDAYESFCMHLNFKEGFGLNLNLKFWQWILMHPNRVSNEKITGLLTAVRSRSPTLQTPARSENPSAR
jgi:hypothetical protein